MTMASNSSTLISDGLILISGLIREPASTRPLVFGLVLIFYTVAVVGNALLIGAIYRDARLHRPMFLLLVNLALSDIVGCSATLPRIMHDLAAPNLISVAECIAQMLAIHFYRALECFVLSAMALDRYVAICRPLRYHAAVTNARALALNGLAAGAALALVAAILVLTLRLQLSDCPRPRVMPSAHCDNIGLVNMACSDGSGNNALGVAVTTLTVGTSLATVAFSYGSIVYECQVRRVRRVPVSGKAGCSGGGAGSGGGASNVTTTTAGTPATNSSSFILRPSTLTPINNNEIISGSTTRASSTFNNDTTISGSFTVGPNLTTVKNNSNTTATTIIRPSTFTPHKNITTTTIGSGTLTPINNDIPISGSTTIGSSSFNPTNNNPAITTCHFSTTGPSLWTAAGNTNSSTTTTTCPTVGPSPTTLTSSSSTTSPGLPVTDTNNNTTTTTISTLVSAKTSVVTPIVTPGLSTLPIDPSASLPGAVTMRGGSRGHSRAVSTCVTHLLVLLVFYVPLLFAVIYNRVDKLMPIPVTVRQGLTCLFYTAPPALNPVIYGLRMGAIRRAVAVMRPRWLGGSCRRRPRDAVGTLGSGGGRHGGAGHVVEGFRLAPCRGK